MFFYLFLIKANCFFQFAYTKLFALQLATRGNN